MVTKDWRTQTNAELVLSLDDPVNSQGETKDSRSIPEQVQNIIKLAIAAVDAYARTFTAVYSLRAVPAFLIVVIFARFKMEDKEKQGKGSDVWA